MIIKYHYKSPIGTLSLYFFQEQLISLSFTENRSLNKWFAKHFTNIPITYQDKLPENYSKDLEHYFKGKKVDFNWPIMLIGTPFQKRVWNQIKKIPHGNTSTYKNIANKIGTKGYQAVGKSVGTNPIAIVVPCHRVLGTHSIGGFTGGLDIKTFLLSLENAFPEFA